MNRNEFEIFDFNYLKCYLNAHKTNQYIDSLFETREQAKKGRKHYIFQYPTRTTIIMIFIFYQFNLIKSIRFSHRLRETEQRDREGVRAFY